MEMVTETLRGPGDPPTSHPEFDVRLLEQSSPLKRLTDVLFLYPYLQRVLDLLRWITPVVRIPILKVAVVLRYQEVCNVLSDSKHFPVPWGWKMECVTSRGGYSPTPRPSDGGRNFVLGMKVPDTEYKMDYALLAQAFPFQDARDHVARLAREATNRILDRLDSKGPIEIDIVEELVIGVPSEMCESYYGIQIPDKLHFGLCTLAVSSFVFGQAFDRPESEATMSEEMRRGLAAAPTLRSIIRSSMTSAGTRSLIGSDRVTPLQRLMGSATGGPSLVGPSDDDRIHVQLFGMVLGFIPTNVLAAGNLLETLLRHPAFMERVVEAVRLEDDALLWACLRETLRFRNINLGPLRTCAEDCDLIGLDGARTRIEAGYKIFASTQSAMFDRRVVEHPHSFDSSRPDDNYLVFGVGQHWCLGAYIAIEQITQMFKVLLTRYKLEPVRGSSGRMKRFNVFPLHMQARLVPR